MSTEHEKRLAAEAAALLVEDGMTVGLGTGTTVGYLLPALAFFGIGLVPGVVATLIFAIAPGVRLTELGITPGTQTRHVAASLLSTHAPPSSSPPPSRQDHRPPPGA